MVQCLVHCEAYRLGDFVSGYWAAHTAVGAANLTRHACGRWPGSIACCYAAAAGPRVRVYEAACACVHRGRRREQPPPGNDTLAVHLRLGDVLDWPYYRQQRRCDEAERRGCHYVRALDAYRRLAVPPGVRAAVLAGDPWYRRVGTSPPAWSLAYRAAVARVLAARGLAVATREPASADADLAWLAGAALLVPGRGGFAELAARCSRGRVLRPP